MKKLISVIVPVYNEEGCLGTLYDRLTTVLKSTNYAYEILFINDGSKDGSLNIIRSLREKDTHVSYVNLSRNYGKEVAMAAGFDYAKGDAVIIIDADLQDPPELITEMIKYWEDGFDDIYAKRESRKGESFFKRKTSELYYKLLQSTTRINILKNVGDFRLLSRRAVEALKKYRETRRYTKGFFALIGFNKKEILFNRDPRIAGKTKWNYFSLFNLAIEGITSFTSFPLRLSSYFGMLTAVVGFIYMIYIIIRTLIFGDPVAGYPTLISIVLFLGGLQLISIGIIGEYLARVFDETKNRPLYFIDDYNGDTQN